MNTQPSRPMPIAGFSPWIILGAVAVLLPIVAFMSMETISRQNQQSIHLMLEKGAALIRSFEAGTRMGMRGGHGSGFQLQRLLVETAAQPDIAYLMVADIDGRVLAHSLPDQAGGRFAGGLDLAAVAGRQALEWRRTTTPDGEAVFEVFGKFAPLAGRGHRPMRGPMMRRMERPPEASPAAPMVVVVGFRTDALDAARADAIRQTVVMAVVLLLVGCAGVLLLFLVQHYRSTRTSLVRVKAFSDELVARMPIGLVALDRDGRVTAINSVAQTVLGPSATQRVGRPADAVLPAALAAILNETTGPVEREIHCPVDDGRRIPMDVSAADLSDEDGQRFGRVLLFKDLSEIRTLREELEKNRRLATVGRLAAGVAHEIRNPLSSIKGFATYFKEKYRDDDRDQEIAAILIREVDRLNRVVGQLLEFSRPIRLHFQNVALGPFIQETFKLVDPSSADAGVEMVLEPVDAHLVAKIDKDQMKQVLLNLYLNALAAMPDGGRLTVAVSAAADGGAAIRVGDTGAGIAPADQPHIFEPYFSTKKSGTGLGLAIVHNIIEAHQGEIRVDSRPGEGTTIHITLPAAKEAR